MKSSDVILNKKNDKEIKVVDIKTDYIKLSAFLKFIGAVETGGMANNLIGSGEIFVNGECCFMRGKKLKDGDVCRVKGKEYRVRRVVFEQDSLS